MSGLNRSEDDSKCYEHQGKRCQDPCCETHSIPRCYCYGLTARFPSGRCHDITAAANESKNGKDGSQYNANE